MNDTRLTPAVWTEGDEGYEPVTDPPDTFFHVVAIPDGADDKMALLVYLAYEQGKPLDLVGGRRYLVNAVDEADARAQIERIEQQIADNDAEHQARHGAAFDVALVTPADALIHARRDPDPADPQEAWQLDPERALARRQRAIEAGIA